jgi:broad specificity phosphatase PhoE
VATIYLVRHGRTPANEKGILAGRTKGIFLDDLGILQAQEVAKNYKISSLKR